MHYADDNLTVLLSNDMVQPQCMMLPTTQYTMLPTPQ